MEEAYDKGADAGINYAQNDVTGLTPAQYFNQNFTQDITNQVK